MDVENLLNPSVVGDKVREWLKEDTNGLDVAGALVGEKQAMAYLICKQSSTVFCGKPFFDAIFEELKCAVEWNVEEGEMIDDDMIDNEVVATVQGPGRNILLGERTALNIVTRASGIATLTRECKDMISMLGSRVRVAATRKTTPGFRLVEKYAVVVGGGVPHRYDLTSMVMLKDNHVDLRKDEGGMAKMVEEAKCLGGFSVKVEVEARTEQEAVEAAQAGADIVMLDNFKPQDVQKAAKSVKSVNKNCLVEVSGGITKNNLMEYLEDESGQQNDNREENIDIISMSALTQGHPCVDFSLKICNG